jgi:hypothetical protein
MLLTLGACDGSDDGNANATPVPTESPSGTAAPPSTGALPPEFVQCMADRGYEIQSPNDMHAAPQQVLQACFGALHQGGGAR